MNTLKQKTLLSVAALGFVSAAGELQTARADDTNLLQAPPGPFVNRIGMQFLMGLNFKVDFRNLGGLQLSDPGPSSGSAYNRNYDNGYNRVDSSGNNGGLTWNWGYRSPNSSQPGALVLQSDSTPATATTGRYQEGVQPGAEVFYLRELLRKDKYRVGANAALGYTSISIKDDETISYSVDRTSDRFPIGPVILPLPPYSGSYTGPGPLISSSLTPANRSIETVSGAATIFGRREMNTDLFSLRLGPYLEIPLHPRWAITLDAGLFLGIADSRFKFTEQVVISDPYYDIHLTSPGRSGSGSHTDFLVGGYAGASASYALSDRVSLVAGARFQSAGEEINKQSGKRSVLNLGSSVIVSVGATYAF